MLFCESSNQICSYFADLVGTFAIFGFLFTKSVKKVRIFSCCAVEQQYDRKAVTTK